MPPVRRREAETGHGSVSTGIGPTRPTRASGNCDQKVSRRKRRECFTHNTRHSLAVAGAPVQRNNPQATSKAPPAYRRIGCGWRRRLLLSSSHSGCRTPASRQRLRQPRDGPRARTHPGPCVRCGGHAAPALSPEQASEMHRATGQSLRAGTPAATRPQTRQRRTEASWRSRRHYVRLATDCNPRHHWTSSRSSGGRSRGANPTSAQVQRLPQSAMRPWEDRPYAAYLHLL